MLKVLFCLFFLLMPVVAMAQVDINVGGLFGANYVKADGNKAQAGATVRGYAAALFGWQGMKVGPTVFIELFGELETEYLLGGSIRIGNRTFLDLGAGYDLGGDGGSGPGFFGVVGTYLNADWFMGFSVIYRDEGNRNTSYGPLFGVSF